MTDDTQTPALPVLSAAQARALGCLIEKEATTPDAYPLTVNAAQVAANQKTAREPVMALSAGDVHHALRQLESMGLARQQFSSRAERYEHRAGSALDLTRQQLAIVGLLLLRGPQTVNELLTRSERLFQFQDAEELRHHIERMIQRGLAVQLPRASGQREDRYMHLLCGEVSIEQFARHESTASASTATNGNGDLELRISQLESLVDALQDRLGLIERRVGGDAIDGS